jgi:ubiquinone/menaquinone biosynthesis C-methylase UbiE
VSSNEAAQPEEADPITTTTEFYRNRAAEYATKTLEIDLSHHWASFMGILAPGSLILDLGCGPGRDLKVFAERGFRTLGIDRSDSLLRMASRHSGQPVVRADFGRLGLKSHSFDAVWAIASLLHLRRHEIGIALDEIRRVLRPSGVLFATIQQGRGHKLLSDGRYFEFYEQEEWRELHNRHGFRVDILRDERIERAEADGSRTEITWIMTISRSV